jgi:hypothetical protein
LYHIGYVQRKYPMIRTILFIFFLLLFPPVASSEKPEVSWLNTFAYVAVHGEVTHGDRLRFIIKSNQCDRLHLLFSSYTYLKNTKILDLQGSMVPTKINGKDFESEVIAVQPFLMGYIAMFHIGIFPLKEYVSYLSKNPKYEIVISDNPTFIAHDYFDIPNNSWNLAGLVPTIEQAQKLCIKKSSTIIKKGIVRIAFNLN